MRKVSRTEKRPLSLKKANKKHRYKARRAITGGTKFTFKDYNSDEVKEGLRKMFYNKCAYCESPCLHLHPFEIEHFRPKSAYKQKRSGRRSTTGYYWLAWNWKNLLPTCIDCNRERYYKVYGGRRKLLGKGNMFPIEPASIRATHPNMPLTNEVPLLLNPYTDDPDLHLEFDNHGIVRAKATGTTISKKGDTSIDVYALQRPYLVQEREKLAKSINAQMKRVDMQLGYVMKYPSDPDFIISFEEELKHLFHFEESDQPYSLMAKQIINNYKVKLRTIGFTI